MYLLDTNVISELRKHAKGTANTQVGQWFSNTPPDTLYTSVMCLLEIERGALLIGRRDSRQSQILLDWLNRQVRPAFAGRILAVDDAVVTLCAPLHVPSPKAEVDALIAANALAHNLTVVTRNVKDFAPMGVRVLNPWGEEGGA